jgi:uncharacterized repeat protein (TIGR03803 family)
MGIKLIGAAILYGLLAPVPFANAADETVVYSFGTQNSDDGLWPRAALIHVKNRLYGTTYGGGTHQNGVVFSVDPKTGREIVLHRFTGQQVGQYQDGAWPAAGLTYANGMLYGTTTEGGSGVCQSQQGCGAVYAIDLKSGSETLLYSFQGDIRGDGETPSADLTIVNGTLYGTTFSGGASNAPQGTVFSYTPGNGETVLYSFDGPDGSVPLSNVIKIGDKLYGTTPNGGSSAAQAGTVFSFDLKTGAETILHSFAGNPDGGGPADGLIAVNGTLYGTTQGGGAGNGTVFSITPHGAYSVLYAFRNDGTADGAWPWAGLINMNGVLYGTTAGGGAFSWGTVFSVTTGGKETVLHSFGKSGDGSFPQAGLIGVNGTLYGTTSEGGTLGYGTVFSIKP